MQLVKLLLISTLTSLLIGQIIRVPFFSPSFALTVSDILAICTVFVFLVQTLTIRRSLKIPSKIFLPATLFILSAIVSTILALNDLSPINVFLSSFFLFRFIVYMLISVVIFNIIEKPQIAKWLKALLAIGIVFTVIGFVQIFTIYDLSFLTYLGWDPHQARIVSSFIDPNFAGLIFVILFSLSASFYLSMPKNNRQRLIYIVATVSFFLAIILTFSRSTYLATLAALVIIGVFKSPKVLLSSLFAFCLIFILVPQARTRIVGAVTVDETAQARIISWRSALKIFRANPVWGVGFNTYRFVQASYGFFSFDQPEGGHSGSGTDSSILLVLATTGIIGSIFFLSLLLAIFRILLQAAQLNILHLVSLASFLALIVHSQFVNSLFFPQIMLVLWFLVGLAQVTDA